MYTKDVIFYYGDKRKPKTISKYQQNNIPHETS